LSFDESRESSKTRESTTPQNLSRLRDFKQHIKVAPAAVAAFEPKTTQSRTEYIAHPKKYRPVKNLKIFGKFLNISLIILQILTDKMHFRIDPKAAIVLQFLRE
jgi:hypothetical protein